MIKIKNKTDKKIKFPCMNSVSIGRAYDLLRADIQEHLLMAKKGIGI